ncbi:hypothetical protein MMC34_002731 [Xylographa carneopallida]|nr:hypothetical protein [Xylographa carneopallida]
MPDPPELFPRGALEASPPPSPPSTNLTNPPQRFRSTPPVTPTPVVTHTQFEQGSFALHSGLVCFTHQDTRLIVHAHKHTGEVSLPRGPCRVMPLGGQFGGTIGMESFDAAALRMANQELGCRTVVEGYIVRAVARPEDAGEANGGWLMPPFVIDCGSEPVRGIATVTAWFLAFVDGEHFEEGGRTMSGGAGELEEGELDEGELEEGELWEGDIEGGELAGGGIDREDRRVRGPEWVVKYVTLARAAEVLPDHDAETIQKAIAFIKVHI